MPRRESGARWYAPARSLVVTPGMPDDPWSRLEDDRRLTVVQLDAVNAAVSCPDPVVGSRTATHSK